MDALRFVPQSSRTSSESLRMIGLLTLSLVLKFVCTNQLWANDPIVVLSANQLTFDAQAQGTASNPQKIIISNTGTSDLLITSIAIGGQNGSDFLETHTCSIAPVAIPASAQCAIQVLFKPKADGDSTGVLSISDNASGSPHNIALKGRALPPASTVALSASVLMFGNQPVGTASKVQVVILKNVGSSALNINSAIRIDGINASEFRLERVQGGCPEATGQLAPGASCSIGITFSPVTLGAKNAQMIIVDDAAGSPHAVVLNGAGI